MMRSLDATRMPEWTGTFDGHNSTFACIQTQQLFSFGNDDHHSKKSQFCTFSRYTLTPALLPTGLDGPDE